MNLTSNMNSKDNYPPGFDESLLDDTPEERPEEDEHDGLETLTDDES